MKPFRVRLPVMAMAFLCLTLPFSCARATYGTAVIWTEIPEIAEYSELFNAGRKDMRVEVEYRADIASALAKSKTHPDIVFGKRLRNEETRNAFFPLDYFFSDARIRKTGFYVPILKMGYMDGRQMLLPVSFNLPMAIMPLDVSSRLDDASVLEMDGIKELAADFNLMEKDEFVRMGFSPRWNDEFLPVWADLRGARFREGDPLEFDEDAFDSSVDALREFSRTVNRSALDEDNFQFKYLYTPGHRSVVDGRILFSLMDSRDFFVLPEERREVLGFRWVGQSGIIQLSDDMVYLARCKRGSEKSTADHFIEWFFREGTQREILEWARRNRAFESSFGLAGGFSALREVTEKSFPSYYSALVGRAIPEKQLLPPDILPLSWDRMKTGTVIKVMKEASSPQAGLDSKPSVRLKSQLKSWVEEERLRN